MKILITAGLLSLSLAGFAQAKATTTATTTSTAKPTTTTTAAKPAATTTVKATTTTTTTATKQASVPAATATKANNAAPATTTTAAKPTTAAQPVKSSAPATAAAPAAKPTANVPAKPKVIEWADLDLSTANPPLAVLLKAPKGSTIAYDNGMVIWGADSAYGVMIDMSYGDPPATIAERKKEAQENIIFPLQRFIVDKPDMLLYAVKNRDKLEYHFEVAVEAHGEKYYLHDKWLDGKSFTQKEIETMAETARGLRAK